MKIAVSSKGAGLGAWIEPDLSNCGFLMIVDENHRFNAIKNKSDEIILVNAAIAEKVDALVTGSLDKNSKNMLIQNGIRIFIAQQGSILDLLDQVAENKLTELKYPFTTCLQKRTL